MRHIFYFLYILLLGAIATGSVYAQEKGSRLNMAGKNKPTVPNRKSPLSFSPYKVSNQPLILEKSSAVSTYYRTLLFGNTHDTAALSEDGREVETSEASAPQVMSPKPVSFENSSQENENLYVNDRIAVKNLYPNPANEYALLQYNMGLDIKDAKVSLYNVLGATVKEYSLNRQSQQLHVDTRQLPNGVYFYQLTVDGQKVATKKLLVRHHQ